MQLLVGFDFYHENSAGCSIVTMKRKHLLLITILLFTFLLYSTHKEEPPPVHGYVLVSTLNGEELPAAQLSIQTIEQSPSDRVEIPPATLTTDCSFRALVNSKEGIDTGVAILNPGSETAGITVLVNQADGMESIPVADISLPPLHKDARLLSEWLSTAGLTDFQGEIRIRATVPLAVVGLRMSGARIRSIPILALDQPAPDPDRNGVLIFPHFATGGGYSCSLVIWNPYSTDLDCVVRFYAPDGTPLTGRIRGMDDYSIAVHLAAGQSHRIYLGKPVS